MTTTDKPQRYQLVKLSPYGYGIADMSGKEKTYTINIFTDTTKELVELDRRMREEPDTFTFEDYELAIATRFKIINGKYMHIHDPAFMSPEDIERTEKHNLDTAQHWCTKWNLVEAGHCGSCLKEFEEGEQRYTPTSWYTLDKVHCSYCAMSRDD